jgi:hypothetical protein
MDIKESKELSFDTQDFPKEVWVFDADNLDQGTEISHLMMSHAEQYTKDELLEICRQASMVIDQLRAELAKAQAVPEITSIGNELQSWVAVWSFKARHDHEDYIVVDANLLAEKIEKLTGANA